MNYWARKAFVIATQHVAGEVSGYCVREFKRAGGIQGVKRNALEFKDYATERGTNLTQAVKQKDKNIAVNEAKTLAEDSLNAAVGIGKFVRRGGEEIAQRHVQTAEAAKKKIREFMPGRKG